MFKEIMDKRENQYIHLKQLEQERIEELRGSGKEIRAIDCILKRSVSAISLEIK